MAAHQERSLCCQLAFCETFPQCKAGGWERGCLAVWTEGIGGGGSEALQNWMRKERNLPRQYSFLTLSPTARDTTSPNLCQLRSLLCMQLVWGLDVAPC